MKNIVMNTVNVLSVLFVCLAYCACGGESAGNTLKIAGGTAHLKVMGEIGEMMKAKTPGLTVSISGGGSGVGIKSVGEGMVNIGNSGRDLTGDEIQSNGLVPHRIAIDGIAVVVHPDNPIGALSSEQIKGIFSGKVANWNALGSNALESNDGRINIYTRDSKSGTRKTFAKLALAKESIGKDAIIVTSNGNMKQSISNDPNGIGYMSVGYLDKAVKGVAVDGVKPTLQNVKSGAYRIQRFLYSVTKGEPTGLTKQFLDLLLSAEGQKVVSRNYLIPVRE